MPAFHELDARIAYEREHAAPTDLDLEPISSEEEDYESAPPDYQISTYPADFTLEVLYQKWKNNEFKIPSFQRKFVWKIVQASKLIESFLVGLPVPAVFLYNERSSHDFLVIDGQQRLKTIFYFFDGYFGLDDSDDRRIFRLTGLSSESRFANKTFDDLPQEMQRKLKNSVLRSFVVQQLDPADDTSMYHIFERLNTGGTLLTNQEIRTCVYHGTLVPFLAEMNHDLSWREILGRREPDTRRRDVELILRFLAMRDIKNYKKPIKDYLSSFMKKNRSASKEQLDAARSNFCRTTGSVLDSLGSRPFHIRAGLNTAVFDSVMVAFSKNLNEIPDDIAERYKKLINDPNFEKAVTSGTTDVDIVKSRFGTAEKTLFG